MAKAQWTIAIENDARYRIDRWIRALKVAQRRALAKHLNLFQNSSVGALTDHICNEFPPRRRNKAVREIYKLTH